MNKIDRSLVSRIGRDAVILDWEKAFGGKSYGNRHLFRVNKIAKHLIKKEGGDDFVILVGAWVHDVALASGSDYDQKRVRRETKRFLKKYPELEPEQVRKIVECAVGHETNGKSLCVEASIVHDADAIDKCGALGVVRHIWKMTNMMENRVLCGSADLDRLRNHLLNRQMNLITLTARNLVKELNLKGNAFFENKKTAEILMEEISRMAMDGKTTDIIVKKLLRRSGVVWTEALRDQIDCLYLKH